VSDESKDDLDLECHIITEYGYALATASERCLRYPDLLRMARSKDERDQIRAAHRGFLRRIIGIQTITNAVLDGDSNPGVTK